MCLKLFTFQIKIRNFGKPIVLFNAQRLICCTDALAPIVHDSYREKSLLKAKPIFFLARKSDQRKLLANLRKKGFAEKAWNGKRDWLLKKILTIV